ncbi:ATP-dependent DNA helicase [Rhodoferax mekongensis]|uniref:AAA family ATPase n=1 Tax=Rhodoferax mekongensis TaxID=3068341 RepID=A0ABZ0AU46_9BURK|nr:AAA family ATPase [Rhodoferax sp. TBRC 17307]WNO03171.1 AAA family ATPase [Rhodoferax sp. TBRC 17307]
MLERTSGSHIISLLKGEQFPGIGPVTAQRVWDTLGESLYDALDKADYACLEAVVGSSNALTLISGWKYYSCPELLRWLQDANIDVRTGKKLLRVYGGDALEKLREDPYRLLALGMSWQEADKLADTEFNVSADDPRRLAAAIEAELYRAFDAGHTFLEASELIKAVHPRISPFGGEAALLMAEQNGVVLRYGNRVYAPGPLLMEKAVCSALATRIKASTPLFAASEVDTLIDAFEASQNTGVSTTRFELNAAQKQAVHTAASCSAFCLIGGAGVGKTTTLNAINFLLEEKTIPVYLQAPTGKAAKRMAQATRRQAMTIAGFLRNIAPKGIPEEATLVVDECSMLDIQQAYQLLSSVPNSVRLILIGDSAQLPPVGPGLTLHELAWVDTMPHVELTETRRFAGAIAQAAGEIRRGIWPTLTEDLSADICFIQCPSEELAERVVELFLKDPLNSQILCSTKNSGAAPTNLVNKLCQAATNSAAPQLLVYSDERSRWEATGFRLGDRVICTTNLWDLDLQNGSIGHIVELSPPEESEQDTYGWIRWDDGELRPISEAVLDALELASAITVHKSQGSEVPIAIVPIYRSRNLDRTILYTAITRARMKVILVGDLSAARKAVEAEAHASKRNVTLGELLQRELSHHV